MIAMVTGTVAHRDVSTVVVDVGGVGYLVHVADPSSVPAVGSEVVFHTSMQVREDSMTLYGFRDRSALVLFELLLTSSGVGPKLALACLATMPPSSLRQAIAVGDLAVLTTVPGVGRKVAQRMVLELKDKVGGVGGVDLDLTDVAGGVEDTPRGAVHEALVGLGYAPAEIRAALHDLEGDDEAELLRTALRRLAGAPDMTDHASEVLARTALPGEDDQDRSLRPRTLDEFIGQERVRRQLGLIVAGAAGRDEPPDHVLLSGPPGLGKTSLAAIMANEVGTALRTTSGPALERPGDLAAILTNLEEGDLLFVDEVHRLPRPVEEVLYPAMEDFELDIVVGKGPAARSIRLALPRFTLVGATTRAGLLSSPLRDRFGFSAHLDYYDVDELTAIVSRSAELLRIDTDADGAREIGRRSRGTPRIANRLLRRVRDYAQVEADGHIDAEVAGAALAVFEVDDIGLDSLDRRVLSALVHRFAGGPVGLSTLAVAVGEEPETLEDAVEPFLVQSGLLRRTPRGRVATPQALRHLGVDDVRADEGATLFDP